MGLIPGARSEKATWGGSAEPERGVLDPAAQEVVKPVSTRGQGAGSWV